MDILTLQVQHIEHFRKMAKDKKIQPQELARMALNAFIPNPYIPVLNLSELAEGLSQKRKKG